MKRFLLPLIVLILVAIAAIEYTILLQPTKPTHLLSGVASSSAQVVHTETGDHYRITVSFPDRTPLYHWWSAVPDQRARSAIETWLQRGIAEFKKTIDFTGISPEYLRMIIETNRQFLYQATYKTYSSSNAKLHSYVYTVFADTGGAHPNTYYKTFVFDSKGETLTIDDLFVRGSNYLDRISREARTQVRAELQKRLEMNPESSIFAEGLAPKAENFQNFYIDGDTLVILIPPYQAAAYAAGSFEIRMPLSQFNDILNPEWR